MFSPTISLLSTVAATLLRERDNAGNPLDRPNAIVRGLAVAVLMLSLDACEKPNGLESIPTAQLAEEYNRRFEAATSIYEDFQHAIGPKALEGNAPELMLKYKNQIQENYENMIAFAPVSAKAKGIAGSLNMLRGFDHDLACHGWNEIIAAAKLGHIRSMSIVALTLASPKFSKNDPRLAYFWGREVLHRFPDDFGATIPALLEEKVGKETIAEWSEEWMTWSPETDTETQPRRCGESRDEKEISPN